MEKKTLRRDLLSVSVLSLATALKMGVVLSWCCSPDCWVWMCRRASDVSNQPSENAWRAVIPVSLAFTATPALRGINCEFLTFKPLNKTVKQMGCWKNWERGSVTKDRTKGRLYIIVCVHLFNDITGDACSNGVLVSVCRQNNIPGKADQGDFMFFFCLLTASSDWPHKLALGIWSMTRKLNKLTHWQFIRFCGGIYWCCLRQMINSD